MKKFKTPFRAMCAALVWLTLILQYILILTSGEHSSFAAASLYFFGFFTILTNILVAIAFTTPFLKPKNHFSVFFEKPAVRASIALYILVVAVVYHLMLAADHNPTGLNALTNISLHTIIPALYILDWVVFARKHPLNYRHIPYWVVYPFAYGAFNIIRGMITGFYPYPFIDLSKLGATAVAINIAGFTLIYAVGAAIFITVGKWLTNKRAANDL